MSGIPQDLFRFRLMARFMGSYSDIFFYEEMENVYFTVY